MREVDFTEKNLWKRWLGVKGFWKMLEGSTKVSIKVRLEGALRGERDAQVGCCRYERSLGRCGYRNGSYSRALLTSYGWIENLEVPRVREGGLESKILERYRISCQELCKFNFQAACLSA